MSKQEKKSFLGGAAVLAAAVAIVKIIGAVYKIPLGNIIGDEGKAISRSPTTSTTCF